MKYARDAFEGLRLMDELMAVKRGAVAPEVSAERKAKDDERRARHARSRAIAQSRAAKEEVVEPVGRSDVATDNRVPEPPFWGSRVSKGIALADYASWIDERALFLGQWGLRGSRGGSGPTYEELVETEGRPRLRALLSQVQAEGTMQAAVVHGYFPAVSKGDDLIVLDPSSGGERARFTFPRQRRDRHLCLSDFWRPQESGETDVVAFQVVTMGRKVSEVTAEMFARNAYREYLELHGLSVQLTEALAEYWHARVRSELGFGDEDARDLSGILKLEHRGARYAWGYPACPDVEDQTKVQDLLEWGRVGVELSEEFQLTPEQSTSAIIAHHPEAKYFAATVKELVVELLPAGLSGDPRARVLYVLALALLALGTALCCLALRSVKLDALAAASGSAGAVAWLLCNGPGEGSTLLVLERGNGLTTADLASLPAAVLVLLLSVRRLRGAAGPSHPCPDGS